MIWSDLARSRSADYRERLFGLLIVYAALVVLLRLFGKRELAQLNQFDLIVLLTISNTVQNAIIGNDNSVTGGLIGAATLMAANAFVVRFLYHHERIDRVVEGKATTLIENGQRAEGQPRLGAHHRRRAGSGRASPRLRLPRGRCIRAVLEPGGNLVFSGRKPSEHLDLRQHELVAHLEEIKQLIRARALTASASPIVTGPLTVVDAHDHRIRTEANASRPLVPVAAAVAARRDTTASMAS